MDFKEYQQLAQRTARKEMFSDKRLAVAGLGIAGEAGEVADMIKKYYGHEHELDYSGIIHELGDVLWYVQEIAECIGTTLEAIAKFNIQKLQSRYPQGFDSARSINREE